MYTSDIDPSKRAVKTALVYLVTALFFALFGAVYEVFSHEVYSFYMIYAFAFPLVCGTLPFLAMGLSSPKRYPGVYARNLYHSGIATLTVGSIIQGILDIYGTTNSLVSVYWCAGTLLGLTGAVIFLMQLILSKGRAEQ